MPDELLTLAEVAAPRSVLQRFIVRHGGNLHVEIERKK
jgi:hypothetical protein